MPKAFPEEFRRDVVVIGRRVLDALGEPAARELLD